MLKEKDQAKPKDYPTQAIPDELNLAQAKASQASQPWQQTELFTPTPTESTVRLNPFRQLTAQLKSASSS